MNKKAIAVLVMTFISGPAYGNEYYKFVQITCAKEVGHLEIEATGIHNVGNVIFEKNKIKNLNYNILYKLKKQHGLYFGSYLTGKIYNDCAIDNKNIKTVVEYDKPRKSGQCAANPSAVLNILVDNNELLSDASFHEDCFDIPSIYKVSLDYVGGEPLIDLFVRMEGYQSFYRTVITSLDIKKNKGAITMEYITEKILREIKKEGK